MTKIDHSFSRLSAMGSDAWCAARLGKTRDWFARNRDDLHKAGFPAPCPITRMRVKADVDAWIESRRQLAKSDSVGGDTTLKGVNLDAL